MAKKDSEEKTSKSDKKSDKKADKAKKTNNSFVKFCSFWGLTLAAVIFITTAILNLINTDSLASTISVLDFIAKLFLLVAVGVPAFGYVIKKSMAWKIIFIVALIIYALGAVFNVIHIG